MRRLLAAALLGALAAPSTAHGHPPPFWWMADLTRTDRVGFELTVGNPHPGPFDAVAFAGGVFGEFSVSPSLSVIGRIPLAFASFEPSAGGDSSAAALGNIHLGLQAVTSGRSARTTRVLWGGGLLLYLPTASDGAASSVTSAAARELHIPDSGRWRLETTTLRMRGDLRIETASVFFFQTELALDLHFRRNQEDITVLGLGIGPGITLSDTLALLMELSVADLAGTEQVTMDLGLRYHSPSIMLGTRLYLPLSNPSRRNDVFGLGLDVGARF